MTTTLSPADKITTILRQGACLLALGSTCASVFLLFDLVRKGWVDNALALATVSFILGLAVAAAALVYFATAIASGKASPRASSMLVFVALVGISLSTISYWLKIAPSMQPVAEAMSRSPTTKAPVVEDVELPEGSVCTPETCSVDFLGPESEK